MKIAVCVKSVPDPVYYDKIIIEPETKTLVRTGIPAIINPSDKHALELALQMKERFGGSITVISMAPPAAKQQMLEALAYGADEAYMLSDRKVAGADTLATSYALSQVIRASGEYDLVLAGNESADGATSQVPSQLAEWLGMGHSMNVIAAEMEDETHVLVTKQFENGQGTYRLQLPCVLAVHQRINQTRYVNAIAVLKAKNKPLHILGAEDLPQLDERYIGLSGSPTQNGELESVESSKNCQMLEGEDSEIATQILNLIQPILGR